MWDELPSEPKRRARPRFWPNSISEGGAAFATFLLSLTVFSIAGVNAMRGPEIKVLPLERVLLYRDGEGDRAALLMAVEVRIINEASRDYGDVLTMARASLSPSRGRDAAVFEVEDLIENVFTTTAAAAAENCVLGARCVPTTGQLFIQRPFKLLDLSGAASRTEQFGFILQEYTCSGPACGGFNSYPAAVGMLRRRRPFAVRLTLEFNNDGEKEVSCTSTSDVAKLDGIYNYLETRGWTTFQCEPV